VSLGGGERHDGYWEFELKRAGQMVNLVNVAGRGSGVIFEEVLQPDMQGTVAPHG
jgi:hypothetical protein